MVSRLVVLLLLGLWLDQHTEAEAATYIDTTPRIWIKPESPSTPWANVTLQCLSINILGSEFELLKDGKLFASLSILSPIALFPLGPVTADNKGTYQCRIQKENSWVLTSAPVEVTGTEPLPAPSVRAEPGPWILQGVKTELHCQGTLLDMTFDLYQEGEPKPVNSSLPPEAESTFIIKSPGNYTCYYRPSTSAPRVRSAPSQTLHFVVPDSLPKPSFQIRRDDFILRPGASVTFRCQGKFSGLAFELYKDGKKVLVSYMSSTDPLHVDFHLEDLKPEAGGKYYCRYRFRDGPSIWSEDSSSLELILTTETLPKPTLWVQPQDAVIAPGTNVTLQCRGGRAHARFALLRQHSDRPLQVLSAPGPEADFVLREVWDFHAGNYSCLYFETAAPFAGSPPSDYVELRVQEIS
ncbi:venom metalloproteinase inhibitor DM43-like [Sminthopsis crassicaudata]|uniref:venom metalloproteinase inhibitor DM43-like n=1 Tax=Sminthopsis crassicaudata TaxID=9301 RepID=UPI003D68EEDF